MQGISIPVMYNYHDSLIKGTGKFFFRGWQGGIDEDVKVHLLEECSLLSKGEVTIHTQSRNKRNANEKFPECITCQITGGAGDDPKIILEEF